MKRFLVNIVIAFAVFSVLFIYYVAADPYSVIWRKDLYSHKNVAVRGLMALDLHSDKQYDSFIFGSSRSENYHIDDWKLYIGDSVVACHSQQSGDNVYGTLARLKYLNKRYDHIKNALIIMDYDYLNGQGLNTGYQFRNPWEITGTKDILAFHRDFFMAFFEIKNQLEFLGLKEKPFSYPHIYISEYDEIQYVGNDSMLDNGYFKEYYEKYVIPRGGYYWFYERDTIVEEIHKQIIKQPQLDALHEIKNILTENNTNYRIIIGPIYDLMKFNPTDRQILEKIFEKEYVFDFSGINEYTKDSTNYYEASHYRPRLCEQLMQEVYK